MAINTYLSVVALNVNELNDQKIQSVRWDNIKELTIGYL